MKTFDELVGEGGPDDERDRLRWVHELLVEAGPPPELTPEVATGPTLAMTLGRVKRVTSTRRRMLLPAIAAALLLALIIGFVVSGSRTKLQAIPLHGTAAAPQAFGTIDVLAAENHTQPMVVNVHNLKPGEYAVYLLRKGRMWDKCGTFRVADFAREESAQLNSPYQVRKGDSWVVTTVSLHGRGVTVLRPTA